MSKVITADYDPETKTLKLREPLEGVRDCREVHLELAKQPEATPPGDEKPWMKYRGILKGEAGDSFAKAIEEAFPPWNDPSDV